MKNLLTAIVAILIGCVTGSSVVAQSLTWNGAITLSEVGEDAGKQKVQISSNGQKATAVWISQIGSHSVVRSKSGTISGGVITWGAVSSLSPGGNDADNLRFDLSADGTHAVAVWTRISSGIRVVESVTAQITGSVANWSSPVIISDAFFDSNKPSVAISDDGASVIAGFLTLDISNYDTAQVVTGSVNTTTNSATWAAGPTPLPMTSSDADNVLVDISSDGTKGTVLWIDAAGSSRVMASVSGTISGTTATWGSRTLLSNTTSKSYEPSFVLSSDGTAAIAAWHYGDNTTNVIQASIGTIAGTVATWETAQTISDSMTDSRIVSASISTDRSSAIALWSTNVSGDYRKQVKVASISSGAASWGAATEFAGNSSYPTAVRLSDTGDRAAAVWVDTSAGTFFLFGAAASVSGNSAVWSTAQPGSNPGEDVELVDGDISSDASVLIGVFNPYASGEFSAQSNVASLVYPSPTSTPTITPSVTPTSTSTATPTLTATPTISPTPSATITATLTPTPTSTITSTPTHTHTPTMTPTPTPTPTISAEPTVTPTPVATPTVVSGEPPSPIATPQPTPTNVGVILPPQRGARGLSAPRLQRSEVRADGKILARVCFSWKLLPPTADVYGEAKRQREESPRIVLRLRRSNPCFSFTANRNSTWEAYYRQKRFGQPDLVSTRLRIRF